MNSIAFNKSKQKDMIKHVKEVKKKIKKGQIKIEENCIKKNLFKKKSSFWKKKPLIYISHIPHGFYENEMTAYFTQFGKVLNAKVVRSKKTGRSRGFGFIEFQDEEVAQIAAETMNNYLMFNKVLKCKYIPPNERKKVFFPKTKKANYKHKQNQIKDSKSKNSFIHKMTEVNFKIKAQTKIKTFKRYFLDRGIEFVFNENTYS